VISRYFGDAVQLIALHSSATHYNALALDRRAYWPASTYWPAEENNADGHNFLAILNKHPKILDEDIANRGPEGVDLVASVSRDREVRVSSSIVQGRYSQELIMHLLRLMDLFDASRVSLPQLKRANFSCDAYIGPLEMRPGDDEDMFTREENNVRVRLESVLEGDRLYGWFTEYPVREDDAASPTFSTHTPTSPFPNSPKSPDFFPEPSPGA
jgi:hypothetical protein